MKDRPIIGEEAGFLNGNTGRKIMPASQIY